MNRSNLAALAVLAAVVTMLLGLQYKSNHKGQNKVVVTVPINSKKTPIKQHEQYQKPNSKETEEHIEAEYKNLFKMIPKATRNCEGLFKGFKLPFEAERNQFHQVAEKAVKKYGGGEGHSGQVKSQTYFYYHVSKMDFDLTVCEIGFNLGHSSYMWLRSSKNTRLYSFDFGKHNATRPMANHLKSKYGDRFHIIYGDSRKTVPKFTKENPDFTCDVLVVDGGHSFQVAKTDLLNMLKLANRKRNIVIFDDCPAKLFPELVKVWKEMQQYNILESLYECVAESRKGKRGFSVGRYIF